MTLRLCAIAILLVVSAQQQIPAQEAAPKPAAINVEALTRQSRDSLVAITIEGRDGKQQGMGTGFVISTDGLIATNMHVIGEARPIQVQFPDGTKFDVQEVRASDRVLDLAVLKIDAKQLPALRLRKEKPLVQGEPIVVMGNPQGLKYSVVSGVVSGMRDFDGRQMIQLAIPVEPGNSGGPVLDAAGEVVGIVTMKSLVTENLGFAVQIADLTALLEKPNPIPMRRWLTIGALDEKKWTPLFGARWQQRAGRILVSGAGDGFGGRSLCLSNEAPPEIPFEVGVAVKLDDEAGAAGIVFHADGKDRHYGFYPSNGRVRLSRFEGPNVFTWNVLDEVLAPHYRRGDWNYLKVRIEKDKLLCYVNDELVIESTDTGLKSGRLGLAKFRQTEAEFKHFRTAARLPSSELPQHVVDALNEQIDKLPPLERSLPELLGHLADKPQPSVKVLRGRADELRQRATELEQFASDVNTAAVVKELTDQLAKDEEDIDTLRAALLVAKLDSDELEIESYQEHVDNMVAEIRADLPKDADASARLAALNKYLFQENGYHGSRTDYYHRANSYLSRTIDDREGLPITLSVLYMELGRRLDLPIVGVGLPAHFVVRHEPAEGDSQLIDPFDGGKFLSREDADRKVRELTGQPLEEEFLTASTKRQIIRRILQNLLGVAQREDDREAMLRYVEAIIAIDPDDVRSRGLRSVIRYQTGRRAAALADIDWILDKQPDGIDLDQVRAMREQFATGNP